MFTIVGKKIQRTSANIFSKYNGHVKL